MQIFDDPRRLRLSGMAAAGADVQPQLRLLMLAEALACTAHAPCAGPERRDSRPVYRRQRGRAAAAGLAVRDALPCPAARGTAPQFVAGGGAVRAAVRAARRAGRGHAAAGRRGGGWRCSARFPPPGCPPTPCPCCAAQPRLQAVSAWPLVPPCMGAARTQPIPHILPPPCACRWPPTRPCVSRPLPKIYCMTGTALCRYCWMGLRYREDGCTHNILQILYRTGQN